MNIGDLFFENWRLFFFPPFIGHRFNYSNRSINRRKKKRNSKMKLKQNDGILFTNFVINFQFKANVADAKTELFVSYLLFCGCFDLIWLQWCVSVKKTLFYLKHTTLRYVHNVPTLGNFLWILNWYWRNITNSSAFGFSFCFSPEKGYVYGEHRTNERMDNIQNARTLYSEIWTQFKIHNHSPSGGSQLFFFVHIYFSFVVGCCMCMCFKPISSTEATLFGWCVQGTNVQSTDEL